VRERQRTTAHRAVSPVRKASRKAQRTGEGNGRDTEDKALKERCSTGKNEKTKNGGLEKRRDIHIRGGRKDTQRHEEGKRGTISDKFN